MTIQSKNDIKGTPNGDDHDAQFDPRPKWPFWIGTGGRFPSESVAAFIGMRSQRQACARIRARVWWFYADLKAYCRDPTPRRKREVQARFDRLFTTTTGFATLDRLLARLHANKVELLRALERPDIPLHTNGSENDIRCQVTRRKISGGTRSETGRDCRDAFLGLMKTCDKLGVSFWDYLGSRLDIPGAPPILPLPDLIRQRAAA